MRVGMCSHLLHIQILRVGKLGNVEHRALVVFWVAGTPFKRANSCTEYTSAKQPEALSVIDAAGVQWGGETRWATGGTGSRGVCLLRSTMAKMFRDPSNEPAAVDGLSLLRRNNQRLP